MMDESDFEDVWHTGAVTIFMALFAASAAFMVGLLVGLGVSPDGPSTYPFTLAETVGVGFAVGAVAIVLCVAVPYAVGMGVHWLEARLESW